MFSERRAVPAAFVRYATLTTALASMAGGVLAASVKWRVDRPALFWLLSALVIGGELLPIAVPRRRGLAQVTISTAFAFAILLRFGVGPATVVYVASVVIAGRVERDAPVKVLFNAAQYALAMVAAAGVLAALGALPLMRITTAELPAVLAAAGAFFIANHVLACAGAAMLAGVPVLGYMRDDLAFQMWTAGCLLAFGPAVIASSQASLALVGVCFMPMIGIYMGGRQAAFNSHRAYHDSLTELPNRAALTEQLQEVLVSAERERQEVTVMLLDVDDFKAINDTLGHEFGDVVLTEIARRLQGALYHGEMLARLGGDEFAMVVPAGLVQAEAVARRLLAALDPTMEIDSLLLRTAASLGLAVFPQHGTSVRELLRHADVALYCAKASGAGFSAYAEEYDEYSIDRLALAAQLRRGIERDELVVHYQPKAPLRGGPTAAVEALVRWNHLQLGCIGPDGFIPLAEQTGLIKALTQRVLECALRQCALWRQEGLQVSVSVNVSTRSLVDHDLPAMIRASLAHFSLPASALQLEITESRIVADLGRTRRVLDEIRGMGVGIAIDDFGTGFSSLSQLQQLPIDEIKIDRSFVTGMKVNRNDAILVRSIIDLARNLGLKVTAEGVETESARCALCELGCDLAQGFHIGRPMPPDQCGRHLRESQPVILAAVG
jgi:diguanylate cyclase (GGDEF)-like protein